MDGFVRDGLTSPKATDTKSSATTIKDVDEDEIARNIQALKMQTSPRGLGKSRKGRSNPSSPNMKE